ncbi:MAG: hypothetical protein NT051_01140 [Candidatus Micrarchaeota archaeon]|nr:hypothetical protein [Candidatus Micrarchaeota archaeon]
MKINSVAVLANEKKGIAKKIRTDVLLFLRAQGIVAGSSIPNPQLVITIGGDGTVLYHKRFYGVPFFAIGSNTSFICQASFSNWQQKLSRLLSHLSVEKRLLLECEIDGKKMPLSLNEIGIRNPEPRVISIHLAAGKRHFAFRADGILFCTPNGSRAYGYSCGGKKMKRAGTDYQVVAISPFLRLFSPLLLKRNSVCVMRISSGDRTQFFVDGQKFGSFTSRNTLRVRASKTVFLFAKV